MPPINTLAASLLALMMAATLHASRADTLTQARGPGRYVVSFEPGRLPAERPSQYISETIDPDKETFSVRVPSNANGGAPGLIVYIDSGSELPGEPPGWGRVLDRRNLLFIAPAKAGNDQDVTRRLGLAVVAARAMQRLYRIDPQRIYVAGFSGGARMAGMLGFYQPNLFRGTIQSCGADFYKPVAHVRASSVTDTNGRPYGTIPVSAAEVAAAKTVKFTFVTGNRDFRYGNILDIYNEGFSQSGLQSKLFDVRGMDHEPADAKTFDAALDYIEGGAR